MYTVVAGSERKKKTGKLAVVKGSSSPGRIRPVMCLQLQPLQKAPISLSLLLSLENASFIDGYLGPPGYNKTQSQNPKKSRDKVFLFFRCERAGPTSRRVVVGTP